MFLLSFFGFVFVLFAIAMFFLYPKLQLQDEMVETAEGKKIKIAADAHFFTFWGPKQRFILFLTGLALLVLPNFVFYVTPGYQYYIVSPFGAKSAVFDSGWKLILPFSRIQEWEKFNDIKVVLDGEKDEGIEGVIRGGIPIRFIDQVKADVVVSVRVQIPADPESFIALAEEFRHPRNFVNNTLVPTVREQVINTGYMFAAQDYISGSASDFRQTLDDQLKNGGFSVEKKEYFDTAYVDAPIQNMLDRKIREVTTRYRVERRINEHGIPIRIPHDITKNKVMVSQVIVDRVILEQAFQQRLEKQRDIASQKRIEMEAVEAAKIRQQKIIAEGETDKAQERAKQEREQVRTLIAIETQVKQEESKRQLAEIALKTAELQAKAQKVKADADAYQNAKLVQAGLTPQERANIDKETAIGVAAEFAKSKLPEVYINGSGGQKSGDGILSDLIGAKFAESMLGSRREDNTNRR
jgi:hypothetical protein